MIVYSDNLFETGTVLAADPETDLALISVEREQSGLKWYSGPVQAGDEVFAMGFPLGVTLEGELTSNVTNISGRRALVTDGDPTFLQLDGGLIEGMSGGPLITGCGEVIGVNVATQGEGRIGLAIAVQYVRGTIGQMKAWPDHYKDEITRITFAPDESPSGTVLAYYNYLKVRNFKEAFNLLSPHFIGSVSYEDWRDGFTFSLDTSVLSSDVDPHNPSRVLITLGSTDLEDGQFIVRTFAGSWIVKKVDGHFMLWESNIQEVEFNE